MKDREEELRQECLEKVLFYPIALQEVFEELDATREDLHKLEEQLEYQLHTHERK